jgi:hypothetical protein
VYGEGYKKCENKSGGTIFNRTRQCLLYADNMVVLEFAVKHIAKTLEDMTTVTSQMGLTINVSITKCMINRKKKGNEPEEIEINGQKDENVEIFKYLWSLITNTNEVEAEIKARIISGNKCYNALGHLLKKRYVTQALRVGLYKTIVRSIVTCGVESWTLTNKMERVLMTW